MVWTLSFDAECKQQLIDQGFVELIKSFPTDHGGMKRGVDGALWNLDEGGRPKHVHEIPQEKRGQVMISYSWSQQDRMRQLSAYLQSLGFVVWLDVEQMEGSVLEKMAEAVEDSDAIIIGFSSAYKDSQACRTEAEYAYRLKKTLIFLAAEDGYSAKGWLGALVGNSLWYSPWTNAAGFENGCAGIVKALGKKTALSSPSLLLSLAPTNPPTPTRTSSQTALPSFPQTPQSLQITPSPASQTVIAPSVMTSEIAAAQKEVLQKLESVLTRLQALEASSAVHLTTSQVSNMQFSSQLGSQLGSVTTQLTMIASQMGAVTTRLESLERTTQQNSFAMPSTPQLLCIAIVIFLALLLK